MMIEESEYGGFTVQCDDCPFAEEYAEETWSAMIAAIKAEGWLITKEDGGWVHLCPDCR